MRHLKTIVRNALTVGLLVSTLSSVCNSDISNDISKEMFSPGMGKDR